MKPSAKQPLNAKGLESLCSGLDALADPAATMSGAFQAHLHWASTPVSHRLEVVRRFRQLLVEHSEEVARAATRQGARPLAEILSSEIVPLADACRFLEREATSLLKPRKVGLRGRPVWLVRAVSEVRREPFGTILIIAPSNYPLMLPGVQMLQALVAGNAVLLKPGVGGTSAALALSQLIYSSGLPSGLLRILPESPESARAAIESGVHKVIFTGSAETGSQVLAQLAPRAIPAAMELSGCDAVYIRADADLDMAVDAILFGLRLNDGQTCIAPRRVFVSRSIATEFEGRLATALSRAPRVTLAGSRNNRLLPLVYQALSSGAHLLAGELNLDRTVSAPLVLAGVSRSSRLLSEDFFAPVMSVVTVGDDVEAMTLANQCPYALGASIFSRDVFRARALAAELRTGSVLINDLIVPTADPRLPFGGRRGSGFGFTRGPEGLLEMTTVKVVTLRRGRQRVHFAPTQPEDAALFMSYLKVVHGQGIKARFRAFFDLLRAAVRKGKNPAPAHRGDSAQRASNQSKSASRFR